MSLFEAEQSGDHFPVDLDAVWQYAYTTKGHAKRALVESDEFYEDEDYHITRNGKMVERPQGGSVQTERIVMTIGCFEHFVARKVKPIFEIYRQCRKAVTQQAKDPMAISDGLAITVRRFFANHDQVPIGYLSILQEVNTIRLIGPLELRGLPVSETMVPDISVGKLFCKWLRSQGIEPNDFPVYTHAYEDGRFVPAKPYPVEYLTPFAKWFNEEWVGARAEQYFKDRNPAAAEHIARLLEEKPKPRSIGDG